jgi:hypothetical protein
VQHQQQQALQPQLPDNPGGFTVPSSQGSQDPNVVNLNSSAASANSQGLSGDSQATTGGQPIANNTSFGNANSAQQSTSPFGQNTAGGNPTFGGGAVVGVASMSKEHTIRIYNKKKAYNEWQFIYNPTMDRANVLQRGPYQPTTIGGAQVGTPASQMSGQQQSGFGPRQNNVSPEPTAPQQTLPQQSPQPQTDGNPTAQDQQQ